MRRLHLIGRRNHGKTTLMVELVRELTRRGKSVGTFKHSSHHHHLDTPGKDSYRHKQAGAAPSAVVTPTSIGIFIPRALIESPYESLAPYYRHCDIVLVEGNVDAEGPKLEVWRADMGTDPIALSRRDVIAVVSDDDVALSCPRWPRSDVPGIATRVLDFFESAA